MPGIDLRQVRREITIQQVLELLNFAPTACEGPLCAARARSMAILTREAEPSPSTSAVTATAASAATPPEPNSTCGLLFTV